MSSREALESALLRSLAFYCDGTTGEHERQTLASTLADAAETRSLNTVAVVGNEFDDYLPGADLPASAREDLHHDLLRCQPRHDANTCGKPVDDMPCEHEIERWSVVSLVGQSAATRSTK